MNAQNETPRRSRRFGMVASFKPELDADRLMIIVPYSYLTPLRSSVICPALIVVVDAVTASP
jgi:hypothetical protein